MSRRGLVCCAAAVFMILAGPTFGQYPSPFPREGAKKVFENERVIVWDVTWAKGRPTAVHSHTRDLLSVTLAPGELKDIGLDGAVEVRGAGFGDFRFQPKGRVHIEEGASDPPRRAIVMELK